MTQETSKRPALSILDQYDRLFNGISMSMRIMGVNVYKHTIFDWNLISCVLIIVMGILNVSYTMFIVHSDFVMFLKYLCASMQAVQGVIKYFSSHVNASITRGFFDSIRELYVVNCSCADQVRQKIMHDAVNSFAMLIKCIIVVCIFIIVVIGIYPAYSFFYLNKIELFFEIQLIGYPMASGTTKNYILNYVTQFLELFYAYQGNILFDVILCMISFHVYVMTQLQKAAFDEAKAAIGKDPKLFQSKFQNCMLMLRDIHNYLLILRKFYSPLIFIQVATGAVTMALSLFCVVKTEWLGAYGFALWGFIEVFIYCLIGTFLDITNDKLIAMVYDFPWYLISVQDQQLICFCLSKVQNATKLMIGGVAELNVNSGTAIFKTIYSYLMVLLNFAD